MELASGPLGGRVKSERDYVRCRMIRAKDSPLSAKSWSRSIRSKLVSSSPSVAVNNAALADASAQDLCHTSARIYAQSFTHFVGAQPQRGKVASQPSRLVIILPHHLPALSHLSAFDFCRRLPSLANHCTHTFLGRDGEVRGQKCKLFDKCLCLFTGATIVPR